MTEKDIEKGLEAKQPCRMELLDSSVLPKHLQDKKVFFDVGHNPSALVLSFWLRKKWNNL